LIVDDVAALLEGDVVGDGVGGLQGTDGGGTGRALRILGRRPGFGVLDFHAAEVERVEVLK
jgi:hypothetical protein